MKNLITLLMLLFSLQSCENKTEKQKSKEIQKSEPKDITDINTIKDTVQNVVQQAKSDNLLFDIEGNYTLKQDVVTDCKIFLSLFYKSGVLKYKMETNTRKLSGDAKIDLNEKKDGYYITFKNIEWSEYLGAIDSEGEASEEDLPLPQDIQGVLYKNEITIQNSGNAMNYYLKIGECDVKYIHLIK
ncbi:hypothetical protein [Chryseobacterium luteum]|uniref:Lipoprotein n=1 Tax=Chryseobacterium luteum TaxID=421531 RepID=A0A085ZEE2_9FLAO|nr:hypothetical protein [Chryseobacterium luteum]KFF02806.1 hypothetical protein IX38_12610 [Chryseobacterium luteum]